jgi:hypothetical protein
LIRAVGNKRLELSDNEFDYYSSLKEQFGDSEFVGLFKTDKNGIILSVSPPVDKTVSMGIVFFILNVMMNQRVRALDGKINKVMEFENKVDNFILENNIVERLEVLEAKILGEDGV